MQMHNQDADIEYKYKDVLKLCNDILEYYVMIYCDDRANLTVQLCIDTIV